MFIAECFDAEKSKRLPRGWGWGEVATKLVFLFSVLLVFFFSKMQQGSWSPLYEHILTKCLQPKKGEEGTGLPIIKS